MRPEERIHWYKDAAAFLEECKLDDAIAAAKRKSELPQKVGRMSAFYQAHATDWQLQCSGIPPYAKFFKVPGDKRKIEVRPLLVECCDSFSVNCSKLYYLIGQRGARINPVFDFYHKRHNMKKNAYMAAGLWPCVRLQMGVFEIFRGPWGGYAFWSQSVEGMRAHLDLAGKHDPIIEDEFQNICKARGLNPEDTKMEDLITELKEAKWLSVLAPKSCQGRWCSFEDSQAFWSPHLPERLAGSRYLGIQQGWHEKKRDMAQSMMHHLKPASSAAEGSEGKQSMAATEQKESRQREKCVNGLHFSAVVIANDDVQFDTRACAYIAGPQVSLHKHWSHALKGASKGLELAKDLSTGALSMSIITDTQKLLSDSAGIEAVGMQVEFTAARWRRLTSPMTIESPEVRSEDEKMCKLQCLVRQFCSQEVGFMSQWCSMYPYAFASLLDPNHREKAMERIKRLVDVLPAVRALTAQFWTGLLRNSALDWTLTSETFELISAEAFEYTDRVAKQITRFWNHFMSSILTERNFKWARDAERDNATKKISSLTLWEAASRRKVLDSHDFKEISVEHESRLCDGEVQPISDKFHHPAFKNSSDSFKDLPGRGQPKWRSPKAQNIHESGGAVDLLDLVSQRGAIDDASKSWKSMVVSPGDVIYPIGKSHEMLFCLGKSGNVLYLWPLTVRKIKSGTVFDFQPGDISMLRREVVLDLALWRAQPVKAASPAHLFLLNGRKHVVPLPSTGLMLSKKHCTLLEKCARNAFKGFHRAMLLKLDREEVEAVTTETTTAAIRLAMVMKVLRVDAEEAALILKGLLYQAEKAEMKELVESEAFADVLTDSRKEEVKQLSRDLECGDEDGDLSELAALLKPLLAKCAPPPKKKAKPPVWPADGELTGDMLHALQPPGAVAWYDPVGQRYQVFFENVSCSRAVRLHSSIGAAREVTQWSWTLHMMMHEDCPVPDGLF